MVAEHLSSVIQTSSCRVERNPLDQSRLHSGYSKNIVLQYLKGI